MYWTNRVTERVDGTLPAFASVEEATRTAGYRTLTASSACSLCDVPSWAFGTFHSIVLENGASII